MRHKATEQAWTFAQTLPFKMTDYLGGRAVKSRFGTQTPSIPLPLNAASQAFMRLSLGGSKCIIIKIQTVDGLHCNL